MDPKLKAALDAAVERVRRAADAIENLPADATDDVVAAATTELEEAEAERSRISANIEARARATAARAALPAPTPGGDRRVEAGEEPLTYGRSADEARTRGADFFRDLGLSNVAGSPVARERLQRHAAEMQVEQRDVDRTDTTSGGDLVPPLWIFDEIANLARAGRPAADLCRAIPLPAGTDSVRIPRVTTGTQVGEQTADNAAVQETDLAATSVTAPVQTIAGIQDVALQLVEQSPLNITDFVLGDLAADYGRRLDTQVVNGSGSSGQLLGILNTGSITSVTYTDGTPTAAEAYPFVLNLLRDALNARFMPITHFLTNPRWWYWLAAALDGSNRPFITFNANGPMNAYGTGAAANAARTDGSTGPAIAGTLVGVPVVLDPNVPTNLGGGTNETRLIGANWTDNILMEGAARAEAFRETLAGQLAVRFRFYRYVAFTAARFPAGNAVLTGTGLAV